MLNKCYLVLYESFGMYKKNNINDNKQQLVKAFVYRHVFFIIFFIIAFVPNNLITLYVLVYPLDSNGYPLNFKIRLWKKIK